jgi:hypothetical protein
VDGDRRGISAMRRRWVLISGIVSLGRLEAPPQSELEMVESQRHALEMALEEVTIIIGQLPGAAGAEMVAQRRNNDRLKLGGGNAAN